MNSISIERIQFQQELKSNDILTTIEKVDRDKMFLELLSVVEETFRPDHFNSVITGELMEIFEDEFLIYFSSCIKQLTKPIKWDMLTNICHSFL